MLVCTSRTSRGNGAWQVSLEIRGQIWGNISRVCDQFYQFYSFKKNQWYYMSNHSKLWFRDTRKYLLAFCLIQIHFLLQHPQLLCFCGHWYRRWHEQPEVVMAFVYCKKPWAFTQILRNWLAMELYQFQVEVALCCLLLLLLAVCTSARE